LIFPPFTCSFPSPSPASPPLVLAFELVESFVLPPTAYGDFGRPPFSSPASQRSSPAAYAVRHDLAFLSATVSPRPCNHFSRVGMIKDIHPSRFPPTMTWRASLLSCDSGTHRPRWRPTYPAILLPSFFSAFHASPSRELFFPSFLAIKTPFPMEMPAFVGTTWS